MSGFNFEYSIYLWLWGLIPLMAILFFSYLLWRKRAMRRMGSPPLVLQMIEGSSGTKYMVKFLLVSFAILLFILAAANPRLGLEKQKIRGQGLDIIIAMDVSKSMLAEDLRPDRMSRAKAFALQFIDELENDRVGLVVFAGNAYPQMPLTVDHSASRLFISSLNTGMVPTPGTSLASAINMARQGFVTSDQKYKAIILVTDGEDHEGGTMEAVSQAASEGVVIFTIGAGTKSGAPVPEYLNGDRKGFKVERGEVVISKLDEANLVEVASLTDGKYFHLGDRNTLTGLIKSLEGLEKRELEEVIYDRYISYYQIPLVIGLLLLLTEFLFDYRKKGEKISAG